MCVGPSGGVRIADSARQDYHPGRPFGLFWEPNLSRALTRKLSMNLTVRLLALVPLWFASLAVAEDQLLFDFESNSLPDWSQAGNAFAECPIVGTRSRIQGYRGDLLLNSYHNGDDTVGTLTSPPFEITKDYVTLLVGGGRQKERKLGLELVADSKPVRFVTGADTEEMRWHTWDVRDLRGKRAQLRAVDEAKGSWGHINVDQVSLSDAPKSGTGVWRLDEYRRSPQYYTERHRPQFHFTPELNWTNDPNGMVYFDGEYHLFYQFNPLGIDWGHMSWGHAVSKDLVHWDHLPVALRDEYGVMIFSGSAVADLQNTSGFGENGRPPMVAIYTGHSAGRQTQDIAYSTDRGRSWTKYAGNPVLDLGEADFRDPKVFWHEPTKRWVMVVALANQKKVQFYGSPDLKNWTHLSDFGPAGVKDKPNWECPDLFPVPVANEPGQTRWMLQTNIGGGAPAGGSGGEYFIGEFDGREFKTESMESQWVEHGRDFYAAVSWADIPANDGRRIWLAWMNNWETAGVPTHPWRGAMSLPRVLTLRRMDGKLRLCQTPVRELESLRDQHAEWSNVVLKDGDRPLETRGRQLEFKVDFVPGDAQEFGLKVCVGGQQETLVGYDAAKQQLFVDRTRSGDSSFHSAFAGRHSGPLEPDADGHIRMHVFVDRSSVEVFGNDGEMVLTELIFPDPDSTGVALFAKGGECRVSKLEAWTLKSAWKHNAK